MCGVSPDTAIALGPNMGMRAHGAPAAERMGRQHANAQKTVTIQNSEDWFWSRQPDQVDPKPTQSCEPHWVAPMK